MIAKKNIFTGIIFTLLLSSTACSKIDVPEETKPEPPKPFVDKYENGFFLINEGSSETRSTVHFVRYNTDSLFENIYFKESGKDIDTLGSVLANGAMHKDKFYLLTKGNGRVVKLNNKKFNQEQSSQFYTAHQWHSLAFITDDFGLASSNHGLYQFSFADVAATNRLDSFANKPVRDICKVDNQIFVLMDSCAKLLRASDFAVIKTIDSIAIGFVRTPDNKVWCGFGKTLVAVDGKTLGVTTTQIKDSIAVQAKYPAMLSASSKGNYVFFTTQSASQNGHTTVYRFKADSSASINQPFITLPAGQRLSGAGFRYDKHIDALIVVARDITGNNNYVYLYDAASAVLRKTFTYPGNYDGITPVIR